MLESIHCSDGPRFDGVQPDSDREFYKIAKSREGLQEAPCAFPKATGGWFSLVRIGNYEVRMLDPLAKPVSADKPLFRLELFDRDETDDSRQLCLLRHRGRSSHIRRVISRLMLE